MLSTLKCAKILSSRFPRYFSNNVPQNQPDINKKPEDSHPKDEVQKVSSEPPTQVVIEKKSGSPTQFLGISGLLLLISGATAMAFWKYGTYKKKIREKDRIVREEAKTIASGIPLVSQYPVSTEEPQPVPERSQPKKEFEIKPVIKKPFKLNEQELKELAEKINKRLENFTDEVSAYIKRKEYPKWNINETNVFNSKAFEIRDQTLLYAHILAVKAEILKKLNLSKRIYNERRVEYVNTRVNIGGNLVLYYEQIHSQLHRMHRKKCQRNDRH